MTEDELDDKTKERQEDIDDYQLDELSNPVSQADNDIMNSLKFQGNEAQFFSDLITPRLKDDLLNQTYTKEAVIGNFDGKVNHELGDFINLINLSQDCLIVDLVQSSKKLRGYAYGLVMGSRNKDGFQQKIFISKMIDSVKTLKKSGQEKNGGIISNLAKMNEG